MLAAVGNFWCSFIVGTLGALVLCIARAGRAPLSLNLRSKRKESADPVTNQMASAVDDRLAGIVESKLGSVVKNQLTTVVKQHLHRTVQSQLSGVVRGQITGVVNSQIGSVVHNQFEVRLKELGDGFWELELPLPSDDRLKAWIVNAAKSPSFAVLCMVVEEVFPFGKFAQPYVQQILTPQGLDLLTRFLTKRDWTDSEKQQIKQDFSVLMSGVQETVNQQMAEERQGELAAAYAGAFGSHNCEYDIDGEIAQHALALDANDMRMLHVLADPVQAATALKWVHGDNLRERDCPATRFLADVLGQSWDEHAAQCALNDLERAGLIECDTWNIPLTRVEPASIEGRLTRLGCRMVLWLGGTVVGDYSEEWLASDAQETAEPALMAMAANA